MSGGDGGLDSSLKVSVSALPRVRHEHPTRWLVNSDDRAVLKKNRNWLGFGQGDVSRLWHGAASGGDWYRSVHLGELDLEIVESGTDCVHQLNQSRQESLGKHSYAVHAAAEKPMSFGAAKSKFGGCDDH